MLVELREGVTLERVDDEGIVVDTIKGRYISLNRSALEILDALLGETDLDSVLTRLSEQFDVSREKLADDIEKLKGQLAELELTP